MEYLLSRRMRTSIRWREWADCAWGGYEPAAWQQYAHAIAELHGIRPRMSRREQIKMSDAEVAAFLEEERTVTCATLGPRGWPHLMPLWYVLRQAPAGESSPPTPRLWSWTYAVSQKVRNLEREARATLQVEAGELYQELRGVMFECDVMVHRDIEVVKALGHEIFVRYA